MQSETSGCPILACIMSVICWGCLLLPVLLGQLHAWQHWEGRGNNIRVLFAMQLDQLSSQPPARARYFWLWLNAISLKTLHNMAELVGHSQLGS